MAYIAEEMMTRKPALVLDDTPVEDVLNFFIEKGITTAPVVNSVGSILGMISDVVIIKAILISRSKGADREPLSNYQSSFLQPEFISGNAGIQDVFKAMMKSPYNRVLVRSRVGDLEGIISPKDLMRYLLGERVIADDMTKIAASYQKKIRELETKNEDLSHAVVKYQNMISETPSMIHSVSSDGHIVMANKRLHNVLRYKDGELVGESFLKLYDPVHHNNAKKGLQRVVADGYHRPLYTTMMTRDGERIKVEVVTSSLKDINGKFLGTITVSRQHDNEDLVDIIKEEEGHDINTSA